LRKGKSEARAGDTISAVESARAGNLTDFHEAVVKLDLDKGVRLHLKTEGMQRFVLLNRLPLDLRPDE